MEVGVNGCLLTSNQQAAGIEQERLPLREPGIQLHQVSPWTF
jgi:hypothetical protein